MKKILLLALPFLLIGCNPKEDKKKTYSVDDIIEALKKEPSGIATRREVVEGTGQFDLYFSVNEQTKLFTTQLITSYYNDVTLEHSIVFKWYWKDFQNVSCYGYCQDYGTGNWKINFNITNIVYGACPSITSYVSTTTSTSGTITDAERLINKLNTDTGIVKMFEMTNNYCIAIDSSLKLW